ncbi:uncharacterized protein LOC119400602 [Rhipicephalus sanguineus]|uniref:uncharacterized protein LOC119400602 n=1 Tax=Rhipicephalus sanguineus TaxID=34632 RepID=UPI0018956A7E|nr:uncharacterized protein LOC119400602 [Rhipicephalus sanguineus]
MLNFDPPTQVYILVQFLKEVLQETDPLPEILRSVCDTLASVIDVIGIDLDCNLLQLDTQALCEKKIKLQVPATLNLTECLGAVPFTCIKGKVLTEPLLKGVTVFFACLTRTVVNLGLDGSLEELVCYIGRIPSIVFGNQGVADTLESIVQKSFGLQCTA